MARSTSVAALPRRIFISYAPEDSELARQLADSLSQAGFVPWVAERELSLGENVWKMLGRALDEADAMVLLVAPEAPTRAATGLAGDVHPSNPSPAVEVAYALAEPRFAGRLLPVLVRGAGPDALPWILRKFPFFEGDANWSLTCDAVIEALRAASPAAVR